MIFNLDTRIYLAEHPYWALGWFDRMRGMIGRDFVPGRLDAMVFPRCGAVHFMWMAIALDVVFLDREGLVLAQYPHCRPWRRPAGCRGAAFAIELPAGKLMLTGTRAGHRLNLNSTLTPEAIEKLRKESILSAGIVPRAAGSEPAAE